MFTLNLASLVSRPTRANRRWTLPISILPAVVLSFALLGTAGHARGQTTNTPARLQALVNDAVAQLQLSYRHDPAERQARYEAIGVAIAAWNKSARGPADHQRLADWLRGAMQTSMPGSRESLPPLPEFDRPAPPAQRVPLPDATPTAADLPTDAHASTSDSHSAGDAMSEARESQPADVAHPFDAAELPAAELPMGREEGDPFRDDPLPGER
jgi:hypothetical protein